jgi:hypothetical protein
MEACGRRQMHNFTPADSLFFLDGQRVEHCLAKLSNFVKLTFLLVSRSDPSPSTGFQIPLNFLRNALSVNPCLRAHEC